jgi:hypothetical protein
LWRLYELGALRLDRATMFEIGKFLIGEGVHPVADLDRDS